MTERRNDSHPARAGAGMGEGLFSRLRDNDKARRTHSKLWGTKRHGIRIGVLLAFCSLVAMLTLTCDVSDEAATPEGLSPRDHRPSEMYSPDSGFVPDSQTAIRIAEAIWLPIYGKGFYEKRPFTAELIGDSVWVVAGSLPDKIVGGVPYIEIEKRDGTILGVGHGK